MNMRDEIAWGYEDEDADEQGVHPGMMIAVGNDMQYLFQLIDAVRGHDPGILIKEIKHPAKHTKKKTT